MSLMSMRLNPDIRRAWHPQRRAAAWCWISLVGAAVTFFGYAYPVLFVMLGSVVQGSWLSSVAAPQALPIEYRNASFIISGALLTAAAWYMWRARCPHALDVELLRRCRKTRMYNRWALKSAAGFWLLAVIVVYIATPLRHALGG